MRNYQLFFVQHYHCVIDDGMGGGADFFIDQVGVSEADLASMIATQNQLISDGLPAGWTATFDYPNLPMKAYVLFDKSTMTKILKTFPSQLYGDLSVYQTPDVQIIRCQPDVSPRETGWKDAAGVEREPTPSDKHKASDFSGAQGLLDALSALPILAAKLTKEGELRAASIVLYAYHQVVSQTWSITHALDYLTTAGIL